MAHGDSIICRHLPTNNKSFPLRPPRLCGNIVSGFLFFLVPSAQAPAFIKFAIRDSKSEMFLSFPNAQRLMPSACFFQSYVFSLHLRPYTLHLGFHYLFSLVSSVQRLAPVFIRLGGLHPGFH